MADAGHFPEPLKVLGTLFRAGILQVGIAFLFQRSILLR